MVGLVVSTWGVVTAAIQVPESGVLGLPSGGVIQSVLPGGPAWRSGVRPGQLVVELSPGSTEMDWVLHTREQSVDYFLPIRSATAELRGTLPLVLAALLGSLIATAAAFRWPRAAAAGASIAGAIASIPLMLGGNTVISSIGGLTMLAMPLAWLVALELGARARWVAVAVVSAVALAWLAARFAVPAAYDPIDKLRIALAIGGGVAVVGRSLSRRAIHAAVGPIDAPMALDLLGFALAAGLAISLWLVIAAPPVVIAAGLVLAGLVYGRSRRSLAGVVDRVLFGERMERASVAAIEAERGRLARDIHDEPLQELSGVIRRLEMNPAAAGETSSLRGIATHLRAVATDLQPPVLEDLGLGAAIEFLAQRANAGASDVRVHVTLDDRTGIGRDSRPPSDVEIALYRITQEAVSNAQHHSQGTQIDVAGELRTSRVELTIRDNGVGLSDAAVGEAQRRGRLGMASMRQRAGTIGADFEVATSAPHGTAVIVKWRGR